MHIFCKDGTTIQCSDFEAIDSGVLFYQETQQAEAESEEDEDETEPAERSASGFVPVTELHLVLPDEMVQQQAAGQRTRPPTQPPGGAPQQQQQFQGMPPQGPNTGGR